MSNYHNSTALHNGQRSQAAYVITRTDTDPGFYVVDDFGHTFREAIVSGPFADYAAADTDRADCNIAGDCSIVEVQKP